jgi:hypothetical protein
VSRLGSDVSQIITYDELPRPDLGRIRSARDDQFSGNNRLFTALADRDRVKLGPAGVGDHHGRVPGVEASITPFLECQKGGPQLNARLRQVVVATKNSI